MPSWLALTLPPPPVVMLASACPYRARWAFLTGSKHSPLLYYTAKLGLLFLNFHGLKSCFPFPPIFVLSFRFSLSFRDVTYEHTRRWLYFIKQQKKYWIYYKSLYEFIKCNCYRTSLNIYKPITCRSKIVLRLYQSIWNDENIKILYLHKNIKCILVLCTNLSKKTTRLSIFCWNFLYH